MKRRFLNNIRRGLGSAYLELENSKDRQSYFDTLLFACLSQSSYFPLFEGPKSQYLYGMILLLTVDERNRIKEKIVESLSINDERWLLFQKLRLLYQYYLDGDESIKEVFKKYYRDFTKPTHKWSKKKTLSFEILAIVMDDMFGLKATLEIVKFIDSKHLDKGEVGWYLMKIQERYKHHALIQEFAKTDDRPLRQNNDVYTLDEFLLKCSDRRYVIRFVNRVSQKTAEDIAQYLNSTNDLAMAKTILNAFDSHLTKYQLPERVILNQVEKYGDSIKEEAYFALLHSHSETVEKLGLQLIQTSEYREWGLAMLFTNYKKEYKDLIVRAYTKVKFSFFNNISSWFTSETFHFMNHTRKNYPDEILRINFEKSYDSSNREHIFYLFEKRKLLTSSVLKECTKDFDDKVVKKAVRILKKQESACL